MRTKFFFLSIIIAAFALFSGLGSVISASSAYAAQDACDIVGESDPLICGTKDSNEEEALQFKVKNVLETVYLWIGILAVIFIVIGGIKYMTSAGEASKVESAKKTITYSIIGLVVVLAAFAITEFFIGALDGRSPDGSTVVAPGDEEEDPVEHPGEEAPHEGAGDPGSDKVEIKSITVIGVSTIKKGNEYGFYVKIVPDYATDKTVTWTSSNPKVASVSNTGRVKALKPGSTTITATTSNGKSSSKTITVPEPIVAESVSITGKVSTIQTGKTLQLSAKIVPNNAEDKNLKWSSSNNKIITVTDTGKIKGVKAGTATITVKTTNGKKDSIKITVQDSAQVVSDSRVKKLQDTVKAYAWPTYKGGGYRHQKSAYHSAYKAATKAGWVSNRDCGGDDCGVFVLITMRNSGWEPNYPNERTGGQYKWLSNPKHGWEDVTNKIKSNKDAKPGDVIITRGQGHVLLFMGKVDGFDSQMASASYCGRSPMSDSKKNIYKYRTITHSKGKKYAIFRKKQ